MASIERPLNANHRGRRSRIVIAAMAHEAEKKKEMGCDGLRKRSSCRGKGVWCHEKQL